ncbi:MAG: Mu-like prophage major head subunit gpT family protein [Shimia sp.]
MMITNAVLTALRTTLRTTFAESYKAMRAESFYGKVAMTVPSSSKSNTYGWLGEFPGLREWIGDRVVRDIKEDAYQIPNRLFESTVGVARTDIDDDELGIYTPMVQGIAEAAARHPDELMGELIMNGTSQPCYDGQNFFDTDHPIYPNHDGTGAATTVSNYDDGGGAPGPMWVIIDGSKTFRPFIFQERDKPEFDALENAKDSSEVFMKDKYLYGARARHNVGYGFWQLAHASKAELTAEAFVAARTAMRTLTADGGRPLGIKPTMILVPPTLQAQAEKLFKAMTGDAGASNTLYDAVEIHVVDWLS